MRRPDALSLPFTAGLAVALVAASLTAITVREVASAPEAQATNRITQQVGFNARTWTLTQPDSNGIRYIGGEFTSFNAWNTGKGAWLNPTTGAVDPTYGSITETWALPGGRGVMASVPDGSGGLYVGGTIESVNGVTRNRMAHILPDGTVDPVFVPPSFNHEITALALGTSAIFVGGRFTSVGGATRNYVAALDRTTGALLDWNPNAGGGWVLSLHVDGPVVYIGGQFTTMGSVARSKVAAVRTDARTGGGSGTCLDSYDTADCLTGFSAPITAGYGVFSFAQDDSVLYLGGDISATSGGTTVTSLIRTDKTTGVMDSTWDPGITGTPSRIYALEISGRTLYVGGRFTGAGGLTRSRLAAFDLANGGAINTTWAPTTTSGGNYGYDANLELGDAVSSLEVAGGKVYIGGGIFTINGEARNRLGAVDAVTGALDTWDPHVCDSTVGVPAHVRTITFLGSRIFVGGNFDCMGGLKRYFAAAVNPDGILTDWNPQVSAGVNAMSSDGTTIYMVGRFTSVNGQARQYAAAVQANETLTAWNPALSIGHCAGGESQAVLQTPSAVYVGGCFTTVGGQSRPMLAKTNRNDGTVDMNFNANMGTGWVHSLAAAGNRIYVGGNFSTVGGQPRSWIAAVDKDTGAVDTGWNAGPIVAAQDASVRTSIKAMEPSSDDTRLYIGGWFGTINGETQRFLAALDKETGALDTSWRPVVGAGATGAYSLEFGVFAIDQYDDTVYIAGASGNPVAGTAFGAVSAIDASVSTWMNQSYTTEVRGISVNDASAFIAGNFGSVAGNTRRNTAAIDLRGPVLAPWPMDNAVAAPLTVAITAPDDTTSGVVVSNPGGINCGGTCEYAYPTTQTVTLQAVPKPAADFAGWTGSCTGFATSCTVTMSSARSAIASFAPVGSVVTPSPTPSASSSATPSASATPTPTPTPTPTATAGPGPGVPTTPRPPGPPTSVVASVSGTQATIEWEPPTDPGSAPVTSYRVVASPGDHTCITTTTSCTVDGLEPGTAYTFTVTALNSVDWGAPSEQTSPVVAPLLEITAGPRTVAGNKDRIVVTGTVLGLAPGTVLTPYVKLGNERAEAVGRARVIVREGGEITWRRLVRPFRLVTVHFKAGDVRSNSVSWKRIR